MYLIGDIGNTAIKICLFNNNLKLIKNIIIFLINFKLLLNKQILIAVFPISPIKYIY